MVFVSKRVKFSKFRFFLGNFLCFYPLSFLGFGSRNTIQLCKSSFQHCVGCSRVVELSGGARCSSSYFAYSLSLIVLRPIIAVLEGSRLLLGGWDEIELRRSWWFGWYNQLKIAEVERGEFWVGQCWGEGEAAFVGIRRWCALVVVVVHCTSTLRGKYRDRRD